MQPYTELTSSTIATSGDVVLSNPGANEALTYDTTAKKWKNTSVVTSAGGGNETVVTANTGSNYTVNIASGNVFSLTLTATTTVALSGATNGKACSVTLMLKQDSTGSRTVTWPGSVKWSGGTAPTLTTTANKTDFVSLFTVDGGTTWYGFVSGLNY